MPKKPKMSENKAKVTETKPETRSKESVLREQYGTLQLEREVHLARLRAAEQPYLTRLRAAEQQMTQIKEKLIKLQGTA